MLSPFMKSKSDKTFAGSKHSVYLSFIQYCEREGYPVPSKITSEFDRRIKNAEKGDTKAKLNLSDTGIDDNYMIGLVTALAVSPIISRLDLHNNHISTKSASYILRLLRGQIKLARTVPLDQRLNANFLGHVDFSPSDDIDPKVLDDIKKYAEVLTYVNAQAFIYRTYIERGAPDAVDASFLHTSYKAVLGRTPSKQHLMDTISAYASADSDALTYEEYEESLMQEMQEAGTVPTLSKLQYSLIGLPAEPRITREVKSPPIPHAPSTPPPPPEPSPSPSPPMRRQLTPSPGPSPQPSPSPMKRSGSGLSEASYSLSPKASFSRSESNSPALNIAYRKQLSSASSPVTHSSSSDKFASETKQEAADEEEYLSLSEDESDDEVETNSLSAKLFRIIDRNGDGQLTLIEFVTALRAHSEVAEMLNLPRIIRQEDGSRDMCVRVFNDIDANNDGVITLQKFHKYFKNMNGRSTDQGDHPSVTENIREKTVRRQLTHEKSPPPPHQEDMSDMSPPCDEPAAVPSPAVDEPSIIAEEYSEANDISMVSSQAPQEPYQEDEYGAECIDNVLHANQLRLVTLSSLTRILDNVGQDRKLKYLHTINLSNNYINEIDTSILNSLALPRLKTLDLSSNTIAKISGKGFPATLQSLNLSQNKLKKISGLGMCLKLTELNAANNRIKIVDGLPPSLHALNLANNLIEGDFNLRILSICTHLSSVHLVGNPIAKESSKCRIRMLSLLPELREYDGAIIPKPRKVELPSEEWQHRRKEEVAVDRKAQQLADEQRSRLYLYQMQWREKHRRSMLTAYETMAKRSNKKKLSAEELERLTSRLCKTTTTASANHIVSPPPPPPASPKRKVVVRARRDTSSNKSDVAEEHRQETREEWCDRHNALLTMSQANIITLYDGLIDYSQRITDSEAGPTQEDTDYLAGLMDQCFHEISALIATLSIAHLPGSDASTHDEAQLESDIYHCHRVLKYVSDALSRRMSLGELIQTLQGVCPEMRGAVDWSSVAKKCYREENASPVEENASPVKDIGVPVTGLNVPKGVVPSKSTEQLYQHQDSFEEKSAVQQPHIPDLSMSSLPDVSLQAMQRAPESHKREFIADDISSINSARDSKVPRHPRDSDASKHSTNGLMDPDEVFRRMENLKGRMMTRASATPSVVSQQDRMSEISTASVDEAKERRPSYSSTGKVDTDDGAPVVSSSAPQAAPVSTAVSSSMISPSPTLPPVPPASDSLPMTGEDSVARLLAKLRDISQDTSAKEPKSIMDETNLSLTPEKVSEQAPAPPIELSSPALITMAEKTTPLTQSSAPAPRGVDDNVILKDRSQDANEVDNDPSPSQQHARELSFSYSCDSEAGFSLPVGVKGGKTSKSQPYLPGRPPAATLQYSPPIDTQSLVSDSPRDSEATTDSRQKKKGFFSTVKRSLSFRKKPSL